MSKQEKGGFSPPPLGKILWMCPQCLTFNAADAQTCKKCSAPKMIDDPIADATTKPISDAERHLRDQ